MSSGPITFVHWLYRDESGPTDIYLNTLVVYFNDVMEMGEDRLQEIVAFERIVSDTRDRSWEPQGRQELVLDVEVHLDGLIGDIEQVEMDFANQHVGFGKTGTQEELILGTSPETCAIVLFNEVLEANEAVLMTGARRYGTYSGYGRGAHYTGPCQDDCDWRERRILAIDAIHHPR